MLKLERVPQTEERLGTSGVKFPDLQVSSACWNVLKGETSFTRGTPAHFLSLPPLLLIWQVAVNSPKFPVMKWTQPLRVQLSDVLTNLLWLLPHN